MWKQKNSIQRTLQASGRNVRAELIIEFCCSESEPQNNVYAIQINLSGNLTEHVSILSFYLPRLWIKLNNLPQQNESRIKLKLYCVQAVSLFEYISMQFVIEQE